MTITDFYNSINKSQTDQLSSIRRREFNLFVFENIISPKMETSQSVVMDEKDGRIVREFACKKVEAKTKEWRGKDDSNRITRETTGAYVEYGVLKFYGREHHFDDSIVERSSAKNHPDMLPLGALCDIKGASIGNVPLVFKDTRSYVVKEGRHVGKRYHCPNVIGITDTSKVWLLGIAQPKVLKLFVDDNLIINADNSTKSGFYGFDELIPLPSTWNEFCGLCSKLSEPA